MLFGLITLLALGLDALSKLLAERFLPQQAIRLGWLVELRLTQNTGMAFGLFSDQLLAGIVLPLAAILCGWLMMRRYRITRYTAAACGLIVGGFAGNFGQRLLQGYVLDMIYLPWLPWFVCNIADICICFGVALLAASLLWRPLDWMEKEERTHAKDGE